MSEEGTDVDPEPRLAGTEDEAPARPRKRLRDRWLLLSLIGVLGLALVAGVAAVAWYAKALKDGLDSVHRDPALVPNYTAGPTMAPRPSPIPVKEGEKHAPLNIVLMGTDRRTPNERGRSDVLIVLHIPGDRKSAYLLSLPRDYWVDIPGHRTAKINAAYSWGGPALTVQTVEQLMDIPIDHTVLVDFEGFTRTIDAVGGVTVYNAHASDIDGVHFPEGEITLDGATGLKYVRNRYGLPEHDFDRSERQRNVIIAVLDKLMTAGVLANPARFRDAVTTLGPNFTVDPGFTNQAIIDLGLQMRLTSSGDIVSMMGPVAGDAWSSDGQKYIEVDYPVLREISGAIRTDTLGEYLHRQ